MFRDGLTYFKDPFNYVDFIIQSLCLVVVFMGTNIPDWMNPMPDELRMNEREVARYLAALIVILMWAKAFYWLRLFS